MIRQQSVSVDTTGSAGSATGAGTTSAPVIGKILKIRFDYNASAPATTDVTVTEYVGATSWETICTETDSKTDVTRYPRKVVDDGAEGNVTYDGSNEVYEPFVVADYVRVAVAGCDALTAAVVVTIFYED